MLRSSYLILTVAGALAGCQASQGDNAILILRNQVPQTGCVVPSDSGSGFRSAGIMDLGLWSVGQLAFGYQLTPLVENFSVADMTNNDLVRRRTAIVQGAHIDISFSGSFLSDADVSSLDSAGLLHFDARFSGSIPPNQGLSTFIFQVIPAGVFDAIKTKYKPLEMPGTTIPPVDMLVHVVMYGTVNDGPFQSEPFDYPVTTCDGCLTNVLGSCSTLPSGATIRTGGACGMLQDQPVDCCTDIFVTGQLDCPAVMQTPPA